MQWNVRLTCHGKDKSLVVNANTFEEAIYNAERRANYGMHRSTYEAISARPVGQRLE